MHECCIFTSSKPTATAFHDHNGIGVPKIERSMTFSQVSNRSHKMDQLILYLIASLFQIHTYVHALSVAPNTIYYYYLALTCLQCKYLCISSALTDINQYHIINFSKYLNFHVLTHQRSNFAKKLFQNHNSFRISFSFADPARHPTKG